MIRVIKHGTQRTCSCYNCGCIFTFEREDVRSEKMSENEYTKGVKCPECGETNTVSLNGYWGM